ncbi:hypothetical protein [Arthrobacter sp. FW306-07-I]|uniref:hypothetical protein n=1 Tax=Arthrobacter sp. FW306-07-I TaxID=2879622 RepID=UPI001F1BCA7D|nr:hypothetical protein [Arthrobacter sp. FW306-07-I]UKA76445.1 hypothetical protein LFT46_05140 [Arthrobacter sp. FW306-07-I]
MTENIPPVPPAPRPGPSYPSHAPYGPTRGNEPAYGTPQPFNQSPPVLHDNQSQYSHPQYGQAPLQYASQWYQAAPESKSSGLRVAAGIVGIVLGAFLLFASIAGFGSNAIAGFLLLVAALGNVTTGIVLLASQRSRTRGVPITTITFAGFALLVSLLAVPFLGGAVLFFGVLLAAPVVILLSLGLAREKNGA